MPALGASEADLSGIHDLFWSLRHDPALIDEFEAAPERVLEHYAVDQLLHVAIVNLDVRALYLAGVNPYLLFFGAIELGLTRDEYYRRISEGEADG